MHLERLKRWHWVVIAVVLGAIIGSVRGMYGDEAINSVGRSMNSQRQFEAALVGSVKYGPQEVKLMKNVVVQRLTSPSDPSKKVYVVKGSYHDPRSPKAVTKNAGGAFQANYANYIYVTTTPFKPETAVAGVAGAASSKPSALMRLTEALRLKEPDDAGSVLEYLEQVKKAQPTFTYSYEWWKQPKVSIASWVAACLVVIGGIWPFITCLVAYGTLFPPPEEKGIDLSKVRSTTPETAPKKQPAAMSSADIERIDAIEAKLKAELKERAAVGAGAAAPAAGPAPIRKLDGKAADIKVAEEEQVDHHFEAKADDFYPVERKKKE